MMVEENGMISKTSLRNWLLTVLFVTGLVLLISWFTTGILIQVTFR